MKEENNLLSKNNPCYKVLFSEEQIVKRIEETAQDINKHFKNKKNIILITILKGALPLFIKLLPHLKFNFSLDFMMLSSYVGHTQAIHKIPKIILKNSEVLKDKNILIIEDVIDSGRTISTIKKYLINANYKSIKVFSLIDKTKFSNLETSPDFSAFDASDKFLIGFGLDLNENFRELKYICQIKK